MLRTFVAVADHASFAEAARRLRVSPTAASRAVAALEQALGTELPRRTTRSVRLTDEGATCVAYVHFTMIKLATTAIYGEDLLARLVPGAAAFMSLMDERPHVRTMMAERISATQAFVDLDVAYDG